MLIARSLRYRGRILPWREVVNRRALMGDAYFDRPPLKMVA